MLSVMGLRAKGAGLLLSHLVRVVQLGDSFDEHEQVEALSHRWLLYRNPNLREHPPMNRQRVSLTWLSESQERQFQFAFPHAAMSSLVFRR